MNVQSNFIDFRNEHRIYLLEGGLFELFGMIAVTDCENVDDYSCESFSKAPSPVTSYKFIIDPELMMNGGYFEEGELPSVFAHRGDTISITQLMEYLMGNLYFHTEEPILLLNELSHFNLAVDQSQPVCDIRILLNDVGSVYRVNTNLGGPLTFISFPSEGKKGVNLSIDGQSVSLSYRELAKKIGRILYALRRYFKRPGIDVVSISKVENEHSPQRREEKMCGKYNQFLRLVRIGAECEKRYWDNFDLKYGSNE